MYRVFFIERTITLSDPSDKFSWYRAVPYSFDNADMAKLACIMMMIKDIDIYSHLDGLKPPTYRVVDNYGVCVDVAYN